MKTYKCSCCSQIVQVSDSYYKTLRTRNPHRICRTCTLREKSHVHKQEWKITAEGRTCKTCHQWKVWAEFPGRGSKSGKVGNCKDCLNKSFKTRWGVDPEFKRRAQESSRRSHLKRTYGITPEDVDVMIIKQDGKCAICDVRPEDPLCVDHCHTTRQIRGLLCRPCNKALGIFRDSKELLRTAWRYLDETSD